MDPELVMDAEDEPDPQLNAVTHTVLGCAFAVHTALGPGHQEHVYANALQIAFQKRGIRFVREARFAIKYEGAVVGEGRVDFVVEGTVVVELKAVDNLLPLHTSQVISYLKAMDLRLALLINFNVLKLRQGIRRIAH